MSIKFDDRWLGGYTGKELMPIGRSSLYYTIISGELPNDGVYTGPGTYQLDYMPREGLSEAYVNGQKVESNEVYDDFLSIDTPGVGLLSVSYVPISELIYFGKNEDNIDYGVSIRCPLVNEHITNIMYKIAQIEYATGLPITIWNGTEVTVRDFNGVNFIQDATIVYSIINKLNEVVGIINDEFVLDIYTLDAIDAHPRKIMVEDIDRIRKLIDATQTKVNGVLG